MQVLLSAEEFDEYLRAKMTLDMIGNYLNAVTYLDEDGIRKIMSILGERKDDNTKEEK